MNLRPELHFRPLADSPARRFTIFTLLLLLNFSALLSADSPTLSFQTAQPAPELDALFQNRAPWIGGDGDYSVRIGANDIVWLFSDTFAGEIRDGKRVNTKMVNNTAALQHGSGPDAKIEFFIGKSNDGKPAALFTPESKRGWFWPQAAIMASDDRLCVFLAQIEKSPGTGAFAFKQIDQRLGIVANPLDSPNDWRVREIALPCTELTGARSRVFGSSILRDGEFLYIYGIDEIKPRTARGKHMILARVKSDDIENVSAWRFFHDGIWQEDFKACTHLADNLANEFSVSYLPDAKRFAAIYTEDGISPKILLRDAPTPWGPWSAPQTLFECPEIKWDKRVFCYAAKAHPLLAANDELVISYVAGSHDFWHVFSDARLYWPRFIRAKLKP